MLKRHGRAEDGPGPLGQIQGESTAQKPHKKNSLALLVNISLLFSREGIFFCPSPPPAGYGTTSTDMLDFTAGDVPRHQEAGNAAFHSPCAERQPFLLQ